MSDTIGPDECAQLLRCTPEHVEELARQGELPAVKIGRGWIFVKADLLAYLAERAREEAAQRRSRREVVRMAPREPTPRAGRRRNIPLPLN